MCVGYGFTRAERKVWREANNEHQEQTQTQTRRRKKHPTNTGTHIQASKSQATDINQVEENCKRTGKERNTSHQQRQNNNDHTTGKKRGNHNNSTSPKPEILFLT